MEIRPKIWRDLTRSGNQLLGTAKTQNQKKSDVWQWRSTVEIDMMCEGVAVLRHGSVEGVAALRCGSLEGVVVWRFCWRGKEERNEREENEMRD